MPTDVLSRGGLIALTLALGLLATGCGGSGSNHPIRVAFVTDCVSPLAEREATDAGAELPFLRRGAKLRGPDPADGVTRATVAGRPVQLLLGCESYGDFATLVAALRQLVEKDGADIVVGPNNTDEGLVVKQYARQHPAITFSTATGEQSTTLKNPARNLFSFVPDAAQGSAGLGAYAYRTLGWRTAATVGEDDPSGWSQVAGFVAEFCSLGGQIRKRLWAQANVETLAPKVARIPSQGVDGVALLSDFLPNGTFMKAWGKRYPRLRDTLLVNGAALGQLTKGMHGLVGVSTWPWAETVESRRFTATSLRVFPALQGRGGADVSSYDAMEPVLEALKKVHGDLLHGERAFQRALARLTFHAPNGTTTLDRRRQAIAPVYLGRVERNAHGKLFVRQIAVVPNVEQTFGGYFGPKTPPPGRHKPACVRKTKPPAWVNSVPATR